MKIVGTIHEQEVKESLDYIVNAVFEAVDGSMSGRLFKSVEINRTELAKALINSLSQQVREANKSKMPTELHELFIGKLATFS